MQPKTLAIELRGLQTEKRNALTRDLDEKSAIEIATLMNASDADVLNAVWLVLEEIGKAIDIVADAAKKGGRLIYIGAGTSGRLGVLDAVECPPTFNVDPNMVIGLIAGGKDAMFVAQEGAEDNPSAGREDLKAVNCDESDVVIGVAASGRTPYVLGGMEFGKSIGAKVVGVTCNPDSKMSEITELVIAPVVGPEVLTGSTRLKAGTAQKMVLNMISTGAMVLTGRCYENLMVDLVATNEKLEARALSIIVEATGCSYEDAEEALSRSDGHTKTAILTLLKDVDPKTAAQLLESNNGHLKLALKH
jgi:N-acetylmuramic acid 6-phosphate etherase